MEKGGFVYFLTTRKNTAIYTGVTSNLEKRLWEHKQGQVKHTRKYNIHKLVYFEKFDDIEEAILREKRIKKWKREWKNELIESSNPSWKDLNII